MKTLAFILVLGMGVLVMTLVLVPFGVTMDVISYPEAGAVTQGKARVGEIVVRNNGWFSQRVQLPEITACIGDQEVPLDAWLDAGTSVVRGTGQVESIRLRPGESGKIFLVASDTSLHETMRLYQRRPYFSCLDPGEAFA